MTDSTRGTICLGLCYRVRHVLWRMPFSILELTISLGLLAIGLHLLLWPDTFTVMSGIFAPMARYAGQTLWGMGFALLGAFGCVVVVAPHRPVFWIRLLSRMGIAFGILSMALNHLSTHPPPPSGVFYLVMSGMALWMVVRTRCDG